MANQDVKFKLEEGPKFDSFVVKHGFVPFFRDYDVVVDVPATALGRSYIEGRYRYRFTHCVMAHIETAIPDDLWRESWDDVFIDFKEWEKAGEPNGFVWGVGWAEAYPGLSYVEDSDLAKTWSSQLGHTMHEVLIQTNIQNIRLVFYDVSITKIAQGNPDTNELSPIEAESGE